MSNSKQQEILTQIEKRADAHFELDQQRIFKRTDRLFGFLMIFQWAASVIAALCISPRAWSGTQSSIHLHVWAAIFLGGVLTSFPLFLALRFPGKALTRHIIAIAQMLYSALLIHLTGGRIETHFHVFGSLAFLAFYRDFRVYLTATAVVVLDHLIRGIVWPQSVYGVLYASPWRAIEHAAWVIFENTFLIWSCNINTIEMREAARKRAELEASNELVEVKIFERTQDLIEMHEELLESEARTRAIFDAAADSIITLLANGTIETFNETTERLFGFTQNELLRMKVQDLIPNLPFEKFRDGNSQSAEPLTREGSSMYRSDMIIQRKDGASVTVDVSLSRVRLGDEWGVIAVIRDITHRKSMESKLLHAQKLESIGQLAAGVAHEINTPIQYVGDNTRFLRDEFSALCSLLSVYKRLTQSIKDGAFSAELLAEAEALAANVEEEYLCQEIPKAIEQSLEGIAKIVRIVRAMKEFSHPGTNAKQTVNLNKIIESAVIVSTNEWKYAAEVEMDLDSSLPLIPCLPGEFSQVILNLVLNAAHAIEDTLTENNKTKGRIRIATRCVDNWVEVTVSDTGKGIPEEIRHKIFEPFFTTKEVGRGTGQGLMMARSIVVDKHGGLIDFESEVDRGTKFTVRLPLGTSAEQHSYI